MKMKGGLQLCSARDKTCMVRHRSQSVSCTKRFLSKLPNNFSAHLRWWHEGLEMERQAKLRELLGRLEGATN